MVPGDGRGARSGSLVGRDIKSMAQICIVEDG